MPLLHLIGLLVVVAFLYWLIDKYVPSNPIKTILLGAMVVAVVLYLLDLFFDLRGALLGIRVGRR